MQLKKAIIILTAVLLLGTALPYAGFIAPTNGPQSLLVEQIQTYQDRHPDEGRIDLTPVVKPHLKAGTPRAEVEEFFQKMGFETHQSWKDKNVLVADYRSPVGPIGLNITRLYRFRLRFDEAKLTDFEGAASTEAP